MAGIQGNPGLMQQPGLQQPLMGGQQYMQQPMQMQQMQPQIVVVNQGETADQRKHREKEEYS